MKQELISVIVPVYNVEKYLERCVQSIRKQSYFNLEIILVDDGATDTSGEMCDAFAEQDERIKVIHKQNGGLSDARNVGMEVATGEYIAFIDSDDYIASQYMEKLYNMCSDKQADIAICGVKKTADNDIEGITSDEVECFDRKQAMEQLLYQRKFNTSAWAKLYKKNLFDGIYFPKGKLYEDVNTIYKVIHKADTVAYSKDTLYFYFINQASITRSGFKLQKMNYIEHMQEVLEFIECEYPNLISAAKFRFVWANIHVWVHIPKRKEYIEQCVLIESNIKKYRADVIKDEKIGLKNKIIVMLTYLGWFLMRKIFLLAENKFL